MKYFLPAAFAASLCALFAISASADALLPPPAPALTPVYHLINKSVLGGEGGWDYLSLDPDARRLYISRATHVMVLDADSGKVVGDIPNTTGVHGIAFAPKLGRGFTSNGRDNSVTIFDLKTLQEISRVKTDDRPDAIVYDPSTQRVFTFNGGGNSATAIDAVTGKALGNVALGGRPEFAVADGTGMIYDNIEDKGEIVALDCRTLTVKSRWPLAPGESPSGIAMDIAHRRLFAVCDNQKMVVLNADTGKVVALPEIGNGPDAAAFDATAGLAFSPNGKDGTLTLIHEDTPDTYSLMQTVATQAGARTMALDPKTHNLYLVTATPLPAEPGAKPWERKYVPGTFVVLTYGP